MNPGTSTMASSGRPASAGERTTIVSASATIATAPAPTARMNRMPGTASAGTPWSAIDAPPARSSSPKRPTEPGVGTRPSTAVSAAKKSVSTTSRAAAPTAVGTRRRRRA
jgi:hypothetical protein